MSSLNLSESTEVRAVLEHPMPNALNGKWSWFSAGYNWGIWKGVLLSHGIPFETVSAKVWKTDMQLIKAGKEGSRELAQHFLPQTVSQLKYDTYTTPQPCASFTLLQIWNGPVSTPLWVQSFKSCLSCAQSM